MKITTSKGQLPLPDDFSFTVEQNNPFFSDEGTATIPATIPATPDALAKLGHPTRLAGRDKFLRKITVTLEAGIVHKAGQLVIDSVNEKEGITASIAVEDSDFYTQFKDKNLRDIFDEIVRDDYSTPAEWYAYLFTIYSGTVTDDFTVCPVAVNKDDSGNYQVNNEPIQDTSSIWALNYQSRSVSEGDGYVVVPEGYGISPFLYLYKVIELMFTRAGYTVSSNPFRTDALLQKIILLNNTADVICAGNIKYGDLVPNITVSDFIEWLLNKFHCQFSINSTAATVDVVMMEDALSSQCDVDLSGRADGNVTHSFSDAKRIVLKPDTSLDGATPVTDTLNALHDKYPIITELDETSFRAAASKYYSIALRKSTGEYYISEIKIWGDLSYKRSVLGSNYFTYDRGNFDDSEDFSPVDLMPPMVFVNEVLMPFIGERLNRNTSYEDSDESSDQKIIIAYDAGMSSSGEYHLATTQKYDDTGAALGTKNLTTEGLYERCWKLYNEVLHNNLCTIKGKFDYIITELLSFDIMKLKLFNGVKLLCKALSYEIGRIVKNVESEYILVKDYSEIIQDSVPEFTSQSYKWVKNISEITAIITTIEQRSGTISTSWEFCDSINTTAAYIYTPPPTAAGVVDYLQYRRIRVAIEDGVSGSTTYEEYEVTIWFVSEAI